MARFRISALARLDLIAILETSRERWGDAGQRRYKSLLLAGMHAIASHPTSPLIRDRADLASHLRSFHTKHARRGHGVAAPVHVIYFRVTPGADRIEIVRILHDHMDPKLQLRPGHARTKRSRRR